MERTLGEYLAHAPVFIRTLSGEIVYWTQGAQELYGYSPDEALGRRSHDLFRTVFPVPLHDIDRQLLAAREWRGRLRHTTRDGLQIWTESLWRLRPGDLVIEQNTDVTERAELEHQREMLMMELEHRINNTITVVQFLARLTFRTAAPDLLRDFEQRLGALSQAQAMLMRDNLDGAPLVQVIEKVAHALNVEDRLVLKGPDAELRPRAVLAYTLAFHELCTNALKHGALSRPEGRVEITWSVFASERRIHLVWRELSEGAVTPPHREGFGSTLLRRLVASELGTPVEMHFEPTGLVCEFDGPLQKKVSEIA